MTGQKLYARIYDSLQALLDAADKGYRAGRRYEGVIGNREADWIGRSFPGGWEEIRKAAAEPWEEGLEVFQWMLFELSKLTLPPIPCRKRRPQWDADSGDEVDNDRLRAGQDYWRTSRRRETNGFQTICLLTNITTACYVKAENILWRGALAITLADLLEKEGHRVELWCVRPCVDSFRDGAASFQAVCLKQADDPLDIVAVVNAVSGWFFRTVFLQDHAAETRSSHQHHYGRPRPINPKDEHIRNLIGAATPLIVDEVWSREACIDKARQLVAGLVS